jgi:hypothetical protein
MPRAHPPSSVLGRLLQAAGYRVEARSGATVAARPRDHRAVVIAPTTRPLPELERLFPPESVHRTLVLDDAPGPAVRASASELGIELLDPSTLGSALGELLLPSALDGGGEPDDGAGEPDLDDPFPLLGEERIVRPRIGRAEAEAIIGVAFYRYTLRLVPHFVGAYRVRGTTAGGGAGPVLRRLVAVNATNRRAEVWNDGERELVGQIDEPHQRLEPQLSAPLARPIALDAVRRQHTVRVDHTEQLGGALVIESRRVPPSAEDVRLGPFALLYVPFWYAEGTGGRVVLDAVTGARQPSIEPWFD